MYNLDVSELTLNMKNQAKQVSERLLTQDGIIRDLNHLHPLMVTTLTFKLVLEELMDLNQDKLTVTQTLSNIATIFLKMITGSTE
jgi:hypothetical protein